MVQGLHMEFYSGLIGRTIKVKVYRLDGNLLCMATASGTELGFCKIKTCQSLSSGLEANCGI